MTEYIFFQSYCCQFFLFNECFNLLKTILLLFLQPLVYFQLHRILNPLSLLKVQIRLCGQRSADWSLSDVRSCRLCYVLSPSLKCSVLSVYYRSDIVVQLAEFLDVVCLVVFISFSVVELYRNLFGVRIDDAHLPSTNPSALRLTSIMCLHLAFARGSPVSFQGRLLVGGSWEAKRKSVWPRVRCRLNLRRSCFI